MQEADTLLCPPNKQNSNEMNFNIFRKIGMSLFCALLGAAAVLSFTSCDAVNDDLDPCPHGVKLRFIYDYNMEFANAFPSQVKDLTVLFYDEEGNYVATREVDGPELGDENYRMTVDLEPGNYHIIAYGGLYSSEASFSFVTPPATTPYRDIQVRMNSDELTSPQGQDLYPLFYGTLEVTVEEKDMTYREYTVPMMKDTNNLRIILQQIDGDPLDYKDFEFRITDNNTLFAYNNDIIPTTPVTYYPWAEGNASPGEMPEGGISQVCWAELSFSRLVTANKPMLIVTRRSDNLRIIEIPLENYLLLLRSEKFASMPNQEYLDRESRWSMIFFLDRNHLWLRTQIIINGWVVRINNIEN